MRWLRHPGRWLDAHLDGELDGADADRVAAHLERCALCRHRAVLTAQIRASLRAMAWRT